jgi:type IV fimbrial biogenesis protein FimT
MKFAIHRRFAMQRRHAGLTLIEVLVVVALVAILAGLAAPSFTNLFQRYRVDSVREELLASMNLAKSEAIRQGQAMTIQKLASPGACATAGDWSCGWQVLDPAGTAIQGFVVPPQTAVLKSGAQDSFTVNRYGLVVGGHNVLIYPAALLPNVASSSHALLCFSVGSRVRTLRNATPPCP